MSVKRIASIAGTGLAALLLLLAGVLLYLAYGDLSRFKPQLEQAISDFAGREFRIVGNFEPDVLPVLSVVAEDISLTNADWSETAIQAQVGHLTARVDPWALWSQKILLEELQLHDVELLIETGPENQSNLEFTAASAVPPESESAVTREPIALDLHVVTATVSNLRVILRSPGAADTAITLESLEASTGTTGKLEIDGVTQIDRHRIALAGDIGPLRTVVTGSPVEIDLSGTIQPADMAQLPWSLATTVTLSETGVAADALDATLGASDLSGMLEISSGDTTGVRGNFSSRLIDLAQLAGTGDTAPQPQAESGGLVFKDEAIDFAALRSTNIEMLVNIARIHTTAQDFTAVEFNASLAGGQLGVTSKFRTPDGGNGDNALRLNAANEPAELSVALNISRLPANLIAASATAAGHIPLTSLQADLTARGSTPRALAASSNGQVLFNVGAGRMANNVLETMSGDLIAQLFGALNPFAREEPYSNLECAIVDLRFASGLGTLHDLVIQGEKIQILGEGTVDLNSEELSIKFNTKPRAGVGISADMFVTPFVRIAGTLAEPSVGLNKSGAALTTGSAIATGGLSILAQSVADRVTAEVDRCLSPADPAAEPAPQREPEQEPAAESVQ